jgi:hypothetical protein
MNHENNQHQELQQQAEHLLSLDGQKVISILESKSNSELPPYINGKVRTAVQEILIRLHEAEREGRERGLTKTIVDEDWHVDEEKVAKNYRQRNGF